MVSSLTGLHVQYIRVIHTYVHTRRAGRTPTDREAKGFCLMHERLVGRVPVLSRVDPMYEIEEERISVCVCVCVCV